MENELNDILEEIYDSLENAMPRQNAQVVRAVARTRLLIADILAKHTGSDGKVPRSKLNAVLNDLAKLEGELYRNLRNELRIVIQQVSEKTTLGIAEAIIAIIGLLFLVELGRIPKAIADLSVGVVEAVFSALTGSTPRRYSEKVVSSTFNRKGDDDLVLNDRLGNISRTIRKEIETTLRKSIQNGEGTAEILRKVDRTYSNLNWRLKTVVETELAYAARQVVAKFAEVSGLVSALRIVDYPHGDPTEHMRHRCYLYARQDEHGLGEGVYPVGTRKIRNPHPRCRSRLFFVMADEFKG